MAGSSIGKLLVVTNFGESHGPAIGAVLDGVPPGMKLDVNDIQVELDRRKPGTSRHVTQRKESDTVEILSGLYNGVTTGTPIGLLIPERRPKKQRLILKLQIFTDRLMPTGHTLKIRNPRSKRGADASSARLTAPTVAAGAIAKKWLKDQFNINIQACLIQLGNIELPINDWKRSIKIASSAQIKKSFLNWKISWIVSGNPEIPPAEKFLLKLKTFPLESVSLFMTDWMQNWHSPFMGLNAVKGVEIGEKASKRRD